MEEFNLSSEIDYPNEDIECLGYINVDSVKEFIKILKEDLFDWVTSDEDRDAVNFMINKLAGDKLI